MPLVPENLAALVPYQPGPSIEEVMRSHGLSRVVKLASNENPLGPSPRALAAAQATLADCHRYPEPGAPDLRAALARRFAVKQANVIVGAGSEGIMSVIMRTFLCNDDEIVAAAGGFIGFQVLARASGRKVHWVPMRDHRHDLPAMADAINQHTKIVYLANPDNPTGSYFTATELEAFMARVSERVLVILDEAYFEYVCATPDFPDSMGYRYDNVITLRTFSKVHGLAGLRVGYGFAHDELITNLYKVQLPFELSRPAQRAALAALDDEEHVGRSVTLAQQGLLQVHEALCHLGLAPLPSAGNFLFVPLCDAATAAGAAAALLARGVIVRPLAAFGWPTALRVTMGLAEENAFFVHCLEEVLARR
jgi:histidinol-phosphate aminotransferase